MRIKPLQDIWLSASYFAVTESITSPRYRWKCWDRGGRPFVILQWTQSGEGIFEDRDGPQAVPANFAFLAIVPERSSYYYSPEAKEPWKFTWLNFYGPMACEIFRKFQAEFGPVIALSSRGAAAAALRRLLAMTAEGGKVDRFRASLQTYAFVLEWWREASQPTGDPQTRLEGALRFCGEHFREPLGVKQLAHEAGMSREHFSRLFREHTGESPASYLRRLRVGEAGSLLSETRLPLREIAMRSGFYSTRHLMRTFQRVHGVGPAQYRRLG